MKFSFVVALAVLATLASASTYETLAGTPDSPLALRAYAFHDVCLDIENNRATIMYYPSSEVPPLADGPVASLGVRTSAYLRNEKGAVPANVPFEDKTLVLYSSQGNTLPQIMLDTIFGSYWALRAAKKTDPVTGEVSDKANVIVGEVGRPSLHSAIAKGVLTKTQPAVYRTLVGRCFKTVIVGNGGHRALASIKGIEGSLKPEELKESFMAFRTMLRKKSHSEGDEDYSDSHVLVSHRMGDHRVTNSFDIIESAGGIADASQIAFLGQLPFFGRVQMIKAASVFVTSHCEDMLYSMFLDPRATAFEIMPYGCTDDTWERFCKEFGIKYMKWQNTDRSKTVLKPAILTRFGLDQETKKKIIEADHFDPKTQPAAAMIYWEDQDTTADVDAIISMLKSILPEKKPVPAKPANEETEDEEVSMAPPKKEEL